MKKWLVLLMVVAALTGSVTAAAPSKDAGAAALLSLVMPGTGEWYNSNWQGDFPWATCITGHICFCIRLSSVLDAANGNTDSGMRIDFWSDPVK